MNRRPVGVTVVGILILIAGILGIIGALSGLLGLFAGSSAEGALLVVTIIDLLIGVVYLAVAKGIFSGSRGARLVVAIVTVLGLVVSVILLFGGGAALVFGLISIVIKIAILWILYGAKGKAFFERSS